MALLIFPPNPANGTLYPTNPAVDQNQYKWVAADNTWRLLGTATGVSPGVYCAGSTFVPEITVDAVGRITFARCVELTGFVKTNNATAYNSYVWPNSDGTNGKVLSTDGAGNLSWIAPGSSAATLGLGLAVSGGFIKVSIPTLATPPVVGTGQFQAVSGSMYWDTTLGELFIYYDDGVTAQWVSTTGGGPPLAGLGLMTDSSAYKVSIPTASSPPAVGTAPGQATNGSLYWDSTIGELFVYYDDGVTAQWVSTTGGGPLLAGLGLMTDSSAYKISIPITASPPAVGTAPGQATDGSLYWDSNIGELFIYYDDGVTAQWVSTTGGGPPVAGFGLTSQSSSYKTSFPALSTPPAVGTAPGQATDGSVYYDTVLGALFYLYNDGVSTQWVQV